MTGIGLHSEISKSAFKQACILILPGAIVATPLLALIYLSMVKFNSGKLLAHIETHHLFTLTIGLVLSFVVGFILENIGSNLEDILDYCNNTDKNTWEEYLKTEYNEHSHKIIFQYINSVVFGYKMELSLIPAFLTFILEVVFLRSIATEIFTPRIFHSILGIFIFLLFFTLWHATLSCKLLDDLRKLAVRGSVIEGKQ